jgi:hypothetical protein
MEITASHRIEGLRIATLPLHWLRIGPLCRKEIIVRRVPVQPRPTELLVDLGSVAFDAEGPAPWRAQRVRKHRRTIRRRASGVPFEVPVDTIGRTPESIGPAESARGVGATAVGQLVAPRGILFVEIKPDIVGLEHSIDHNVGPGHLRQSHSNTGCVSSDHALVRRGRRRAAQSPRPAASSRIAGRLPMSRGTARCTSPWPG